MKNKSTVVSVPGAGFFKVAGGKSSGCHTTREAAQAALVEAQRSGLKTKWKNDPKAKVLARADAVTAQLDELKMIVARYKANAKAGAGATWSASGSLANASEILADLRSFLYF